jgi:PEP-CTERM motif
MTLNDFTLDGAFDLSLPSFTLDSPGETIFVLLSLVGFAELGGHTDASHTFVASFDDETGLRPAVTVAEPATIALLCLGLTGLCFKRRRA